MKGALFTSVFVIILVVAWLFLKEKGQDSSPRDIADDLVEQKSNDSQGGEEKPSGPLYYEERSEDAPGSHLADTLNQPDGSAKEDVKMVKDIFMHYRSTFKENPVGTHRQILRYLTGDNSQGIAYIPKNHPAVFKGELYDRWGTPFYFHQISATVMEVRSAGPDGIHWNTDDVIIR